MFGQKPAEERALDKQLSSQEKQSREQSMLATVDPSDGPYLEKKEGMQDLTRWQQDLDNEIVSLMHDFKSQIFIEGKWLPIKETKYIQDEKGVTKGVPVPIKPIMNDEGIYRIISLVKRYLTRNVMMSNYSEQIIVRTMRGLVIDVGIHIALNWKRYEMDYSDLSIVMRMIKDSVEPTLYRCYNNGERRYLNTINKRIEALNMTPDGDKKKGMFAELLGGMK